MHRSAQMSESAIVQSTETAMGHLEEYLNLMVDAVSKNTLLFNSDNVSDTLGKLHDDILAMSGCADTSLADAELTHEGFKENIARASRAAAALLRSLLQRFWNWVMGWFTKSKVKVDGLDELYSKFIANAKKSDELYRQEKLITGKVIPSEVSVKAAQSGIRLLRGDNNTVIFSTEAFSEMEKMLSRKVKADNALLVTLSVDGRLKAINQYMDDAIALGKSFVHLAEHKTLQEMVQVFCSISSEKDVDNFLRTYVGSGSKNGSTVIDDYNTQMVKEFHLTEKLGIFTVGQNKLAGNVKVLKRMETFCGTSIVMPRLILDPKYTESKPVELNSGDIMPKDASFMKNLRWPNIKEAELKGILSQLYTLQGLCEKAKSQAETMQENGKRFTNNDGRTVEGVIEKLTKLSEGTTRQEDFKKLIRSASRINSFVGSYIVLSQQLAVLYCRYVDAIGTIMQDLLTVELDTTFTTGEEDN